MRVINPLKPTSCKVKSFEDDGAVVVIIVVNQGEVLRDGDGADTIFLEICNVLMLGCKGCGGLDGHVVDGNAVAFFVVVDMCWGGG